MSASHNAGSSQMGANIFRVFVSIFCVFASIIYWVFESIIYRVCSWMPLILGQNDPWMPWILGAIRYSKYQFIIQNRPTMPKYIRNVWNVWEIRINQRVSKYYLIIPIISIIHILFVGVFFVVFHYLLKYIHIRRHLRTPLRTPLRTHASLHA